MTIALSTTGKIQPVLFDMDPTSLAQLLSVFLLSALNAMLTEATVSPYVTCGSLLKLSNNNYKARLHSHDIKYGSGSGQQSVTGTDEQEDGNSYWAVKAAMADQCRRGEPIACGTNIRLEHVNSGKNLHSHLFSSPLSGNQEVSAFGKEGDGDTGDNWTIMCNEEFWERAEAIRLKHVDTEK